MLGCIHRHPGPCIAHRPWVGHPCNGRSTVSGDRSFQTPHWLLVAVWPRASCLASQPPGSLYIHEDNDTILLCCWEGWRQHREESTPCLAPGVHSAHWNLLLWLEPVPEPEDQAWRPAQFVTSLPQLGYVFRSDDTCSQPGGLGPGAVAKDGGRGRAHPSNSLFSH